MPKMTRNRTLVGAGETTYGTFETMTNADAIRVIDPAMDANSTFQNRDLSSGIDGFDVGAPEADSMTLKFRLKVHGDGSTGDPAWAADLFPSVGMPSNTTNSYQTTGTTTNWKGLSAALNVDGIRYTMRGGMGDFTNTWESGKAEIIEFNYVGGYNANPTATSQLTGISFETPVPPKFAGASSFTVNSSTTVATKISKATLKLNTNPAPRQDPNAVGGNVGGWIVAPHPTFESDPEAEAIGAKDWDAIYDAGTTFTNVLVVGTVTGNICTTTITGLQLNKRPTLGDRNGIAVHNISCNVTGTVTKVWS